MTFKHRIGQDSAKRILIISLLLAMLGLPSLAATAEAVGNPHRQKIPFPRPQSHTANWIEYHGRSADVSVIDTGTTCLVCHEKTDCFHATIPRCLATTRTPGAR